MTFSLTILGSSSALPTSNRFPSAHVLNVHERYFLIDCGEGTQMQLRRFRIRIGKINHIFISHVHGDHTFGLFGLISTMALLDRATDLHIYSPLPLESIIREHLGAFDIRLPFEIIFHTLSCTRSEQIFEDEKVTVETIPLKHRVPTCGFLFREKPALRNIKKEAIDYYHIPVKWMQKIKEGEDFITGAGKVIPNGKLTTEPRKPRSFAYCSDTVYTEQILTKISGVDLLFHEATFMEDMAEQARDTLHTTGYQAASLARKAGVGTLILGHISARYKDPEPLLAEAKTIFENTFLAEDGRTFSVGL